MSRQTWITVVLGVLVFHAGLFLLFGQMRALPKMRHIPPPNFGYKERTYFDPKSGEREIHREIRVSTKLANRQQVEAAERAAKR